MDTTLLKKIPLFSALDEAALSELKAYLKETTFPQNETIFWMDEKGDELFIVINGKVRISYTDDKGQELTLAVLKQGDFFGELSMIDGGLRLATARCITEVKLMTLNRASFYHFLHKHPLLSDTMLETMSARLRSNTARIHTVMNVNAELEKTKSSFQRFIDKVAKSLTSSMFLKVYIIFIIGWICLHIYLFQKKAELIDWIDKPPTFFWLSFMITLSSFLLNVLILNSQSRQAENDRIRGEIEYQVNLKAQTEVIKLQYKMDKLTDMVSSLTGEEKEEADSHL
jgi:CRP-like cAMP-binding protein